MEPRTKEGDRRVWVLDPVVEVVKLLARRHRDLGVAREVVREPRRSALLRPYPEKGGERHTVYSLAGRDASRKTPKESPLQPHDLYLLSKIAESTSGLLVGDRNYHSPKTKEELATMGIGLLAL
jgi:hypothetical protein